MSAPPNDALLFAHSVQAAHPVGNPGPGSVVEISKIHTPARHQLVHATVTAQAPGMPAVRFVGDFEHGVDAAIAAKERFPSATRIVVVCTQEQQP